METGHLGDLSAKHGEFPAVCNFHTVFLLSHRYFAGTYLGELSGITFIFFPAILFVMIAAFLTYFLTGRIYLMGNVFTTYYVSMSVFLAYAASWPDMQILLWFVIPIKMKWMAWVYGIIIVYNNGDLYPLRSLGNGCSHCGFLPEFCSFLL